MPQKHLQTSGGLYGLWQRPAALTGSLIKEPLSGSLAGTFSGLPFFKPRRLPDEEPCRASRDEAFLAKRIFGLRILGT